MEAAKKKKQKLAILTCIFVILMICGVIVAEYLNPDESYMAKFEMQQQIKQEFEDLMTKYGIENPKWGFELAGDDESEEYDGKPLTTLDIDTAFSSDIYTPLIFTLYNYGLNDLSEEDIKNLLIDAYKLTNKWMWEYNKELDSTEERKAELEEYFKEEDKDIGNMLEPIYPYSNVYYISYKDEGFIEADYYFLKDIALPSSTEAVHIITCGNLKGFEKEKKEHKLVLIDNLEEYSDDYYLDRKIRKTGYPSYYGKEPNPYEFLTNGLYIDMINEYEESDEFKESEQITDTWSNAYDSMQ